MSTLKRYAVGYVNILDEKLELSLIEAESGEQAMRQVLEANEWELPADVGHVQDFASENDCEIQAIRVPDREGDGE